MRAETVQEEMNTQGRRDAAADGRTKPRILRGEHQGRMGGGVLWQRSPSAAVPPTFPLMYSPRMSAAAPARLPAVVANAAPTRPSPACPTSTAWPATATSVDASPTILGATGSCCAWRMCGWGRPNLDWVRNGCEVKGWKGGQIRRCTSHRTCARKADWHTMETRRAACPTARSLRKAEAWDT